MSTGGAANVEDGLGGDHASDHRGEALSAGGRPRKSIHAFALLPGLLERLLCDPMTKKTAA